MKRIFLGKKPNWSYWIIDMPIFNFLDINRLSSKVFYQFTFAGDKSNLDSSGYK